MRSVWPQAQGLPKLTDAEQVGDVSACDTPVTPVVGEVIPCLNCKMPGVLRCTQCKAARYCSKECQRQTQHKHGMICASIVELERMQKEDRYRERTVRQNQLNQKIKLKLVKLVGRKPKLQCYVSGMKMEVLWDTGSMVSLADRLWVAANFPDNEILPVADFLDGEELKLSAANSTEIMFDGVILVTFGLEEGKDLFVVPVLVSSQPMAEPILGFNVIEHLVLEGSEIC